jgi:hypothetical protein
VRRSRLGIQSLGNVPQPVCHSSRSEESAFACGGKLLHGLSVRCFYERTHTCARKSLS